MLHPLVLSLQGSCNLAGLGVGRAGAGELLHTTVLIAVIMGRTNLLQDGDAATSAAGNWWETTHQSIFRLCFQVQLDEAKA